MPYQAQGLTFDQFELDTTYATAARTVTMADIVTFAGVSGDFNPLHTDEIFAKTTPHGTRIAHGMLTAAISTGLSNQTRLFEGTTIALLEQTLRYTAPVKPGDTIHLELTCTNKKLSSKGDKGVVTFRSQVINHNGVTVLDGEWKTLMRK